MYTRMGQFNKIYSTLIVEVLLEALCVLEKWAQVQEKCKQLKYTLTVSALVLGIDRSLIGHEILLTDFRGAK